jgi:hypothetical protein
LQKKFSGMAEFYQNHLKIDQFWEVNSTEILLSGFRPFLITIIHITQILVGFHSKTAETSIVNFRPKFGIQANFNHF